ncbi:unnamed protein product [Brachionus calyciflorus]|uniref:Transmembrane protein n=1 Tax=Brachionus calyciflorus TaxID=104777 RepID=A0A813SDZ0_9BILA|nr:unnamed protein product [Brachionus calyciflorus]
MTRHTCKILSLLVPSLASITLLIYSIISDTWLTIDYIKLENLTKNYRGDFEIYKNKYELFDPSQNSDQFSSDNLFNTKKLGNKQDLEYPNYVYITKLWPFRSSKSLYSECLQYHELKLKLSVSYLQMEKKEPLVGTIHYFNKKNNDRIICDEKSGMIKCVFNGQCRQGKTCDGVFDCEDQSDEQMCTESRSCQFKNDISGFKCDNKCWQYWNKCDQIPHCLNQSDEHLSECSNTNNLIYLPTLNDLQSTQNLSTYFRNLINQANSQLATYSLGSNYYNSDNKCYKNYFNYRIAKLIPKDSLKYLSQQLADNIQEMNNINYHLQLIYNLCFGFSLIFAFMALISLGFIMCFRKMCFQCPFWFYGFFQIVSWLTGMIGLMTFLYQFYTNKQKFQDPKVQLPIKSEIMRLNPQLNEIEILGVSFWLAVAATSISCLVSFMSCFICCRLPSSRHGDKEYKIMQFPTYS